MQSNPAKSVLRLAAEEQSNLDRHLKLLGDTYGLTTQLESLYDTLPKQCRFPLDVATNDAGHAAGLNAHLMFPCRRELTTGLLTLLRGYRIDSLYHLRKAIETCAFAAKISRHPAMSRVWLQAGTSEEGWNKFREKFVKLFPKDDRELTFLSGAFDEASEAMHGSIYSVAHYLLEKRRTDAVPTSDVFDIGNDGVLVAQFIRTIDCHLTILIVFQRILKPYASVGAWSNQLDSAKASFGDKHQQWLPLVQSVGS
jgi:hypothetical protein